MSHRTINIIGYLDVYKTDTHKAHPLINATTSLILKNVINVVESSYEELGIFIEEKTTQKQNKKYIYHYYAELYNARTPSKDIEYVDGIIELEFLVKNEHNYMGAKMAIANEYNTHGGTFVCCVIMNLTLITTINDARTPK